MTVYTDLNGWQRDAQPQTAAQKFGFDLKIRRLRLRLTQAQVAAAVGCAQQTIAAFESGARIPDALTYIALDTILQPVVNTTS